MKCFKTKYKKKKKSLGLIILFIFLLDFIFISYFSNKLSKNIVNITRLKIEEITKDYLNDTIKKYLNLETNDYIKLNIVNNNIESVDIDNNKSNILLKNIIEDLENNSENIIKGNINDYYNLELLQGNNGIILHVPTGVMTNNALLANLGPKIPIKASFLNNIESNVDVTVSDYGINNALIKLYIIINLKIVIEMPTESEVSNISYKYLIASKLINGVVPDFIGSSIVK